MKVFEIVPNKVAYSIGFQCASKTVLAYLYCIKYGMFPIDDRRPQAHISEKILNDPVENEKRIQDRANFGNYPVRFCVVRDPVDRFLNAYETKINTRLSTRQDVSLGEVIQNIDNESFIEENQTFITNVRSLQQHYGPNPSVYTHIFNIKQINQVKALLESESGVTLPDVHLNKPDPTKIIQASQEQLDWIKNRYKTDYDLYGQWI